MFPDPPDEARRLELAAQKILLSGFSSKEESRRVELLAQEILAGGFVVKPLEAGKVVSLEAERSKRRVEWEAE